MRVIRVGLIWVGLACGLPVWADETGRWQRGVTVFSDYVYRGFSYSADAPSLGLGVTHHGANHRLSTALTMVRLEDADGVQARLGYTRYWVNRPELELWSGFQITSGGPFPDLHEMVNGVRWRWAGRYLRSESFVALGGRLGSRHVDVELGWEFNNEMALAASWGNTRSFAYLDNADHDYYRVSIRGDMRKARWSLNFERAYDVGVTKALDDAPRVTASWYWPL